MVWRRFQGTVFIWETNTGHLGRVSPPPTGTSCTSSYYWYFYDRTWLLAKLLPHLSLRNSGRRLSLAYIETRRVYLERHTSPNEVRSVSWSRYIQKNPAVSSATTGQIVFVYFQDYQLRWNYRFLIVRRGSVHIFCSFPFKKSQHHQCGLWVRKKVHSV